LQEPSQVTHFTPEKTTLQYTTPILQSRQDSLKSLLKTGK